MKTIIIIATVLFSAYFAIAQNTIQQAPLNPDYIQYTTNLHNGNSLTTSSNGHTYGVMPMPVLPDFSNYFRSTHLSRNFPAIYDLRALGKMTAVKDQGACGSCYSFATIASIESNWKVLGLGDFDLSEDNINNCHGWNQGACNTGNHYVTTAYLLRKAGPVMETDDPYQPSAGSCPSGLHEVAYVNAAKFLPKDANAIKQAIMDYGAIYTTLYMDDANLNPTNGTYYYNGTNGINHAIVVAGWNDNMVTAGGTGAWICKNSGGTSWGDNGYFYVSYNDTKILNDNACWPSRIEYNPNEKLHTYDEFGWFGNVGWGADNTDYGLLKFMATSNEVISKVGTFVGSTGAILDFEVYDNFDGNTLTGLLGSTTNQQCDFPGYYAFNLATPIPIASGNDYYIKVKYNTPGNLYPIPIEQLSGGSSNIVIETGKCWFSNQGNNGEWYAIGTGTQYVYDLCITAYGTTTTPTFCYKTPGLSGSAIAISSQAATVTTAAASNIGSATATLNGMVNANNASTTVTFEYGLTTSYGNIATATQSPVSGSANTNVSIDITGLAAATTYHYRVKGVNSNGTVNGNDLTFSTSCVAPSLQASVFVCYVIGNNSMTVKWWRGNGDNLLILAKAGSPVNSDPVDGTTYTANSAFGTGNQVGTGNFVVFNGNGTALDLTSLTAGTTYYFSFYEYNNVGKCYKNPAYTASMATTYICSPPNTQASNCINSNVTQNSMTIDWTRGNGTKVVVIAKAGEEVNVIPANGSSYTANTSFGSGDQVGTGNYVVYNGTGNSVTLTSLEAGVTYYYAIFELNAAEICFKTPGLTGHQTTTPNCVTPSNQATNITSSAVTTNSLTLGWNRGDGDKVLVVARAGAAVNSTPVYGTSYVGNASYGSGAQIGLGNYLVYSGVGNSANISNLAAGTTYYFDIYEYNNLGVCYKLPPLSSDITTAQNCSPPANQATAFNTSNITETTAKVSWVRGNGNNILVVARAGSAVNADPIPGYFYNASPQFGVGDQVGTGNFVVYKGSGTSVTLTGLTIGTSYYFSIYEY